MTTTQNPYWTPIAAGIIGALIASGVGRQKTRIDNALIGGLFTGFAAYRDPRNTVWLTILVAAVEGGLWGAFDHTTPLIKDIIMPPTKKD